MATLQFRLLESTDLEGVVRLVLVGELDLAVADQLLDRLQQLIGDHRRVLLDLSGLEYIDSRGMYALIRAIVLGRQADGQFVEIDPELNATVRDAFELAGVARLLWPPDARGTTSTTP